MQVGFDILEHFRKIREGPKSRKRLISVGSRTRRREPITPEEISSVQDNEKN